MAADTKTHDVKTTHADADECHFPGQPFGLLARHDPANIIGVEADADVSPGGSSVGRVAHAYIADRIELDLSEVPADVFADWLVILGHAGRGYPVVYSELGSSSYGASEYVVTSHLADWTQHHEGAGQWSGRVTLVRKGSAY